MRVGAPIRAMAVCGLVLMLAPWSPAMAGAYVFAAEGQEGLITHPIGYTGTGGTLTVRVCIDPASPNAAAMEIPVQNNINIYNRLQPTTGNLALGAGNNLASNQIDFESVALHEIGHCLGMAHVNLASESGLTGADQNYTKSTDGPGSGYGLNPGPDGVIGSSDDQRGNDVNLHWFRRSNNNPFTIDNPVDKTTYSRLLSALPAGHSFAANGDRGVANLLSVPNTEAVMQQGTYYDEAQRTLTHDDVATLLFAAAGLDETAGTSDDYSIRLEYGGISSTGCDITMAFTGTTGLAFCATNGVIVSGVHVRITSASIEFGQAFNWFFNTETVNQAPVLDPVGDQTVAEGQTLSVPISATDADASDSLAFNATGLPAFATLTDNGDGTATLDINPGTGDAGTYPVTLMVQDNGLPVLSATETFDIVVTNPDSDGDGLSDVYETTVSGTDPNNPDTDGDGLADGADGAVSLAILPGGIDMDGDGFVDGEQDFGSDPTLADTDGDRIDDGVEVANGSNPADATSWPNFADGDVAPLGNPDGQINAGDYLVAQRIALGLVTASPLELAHGDLYPPGAPDGVINLSDLILLLQLVQQQ